MNPKNYDPQMHSAEHILNGVMVKKFNKGRSFSNHIEKKKSKCDYNFERNLTENEITEITKEVNNVIDKSLDVSEEFVNRDVAENIFNLEKLPEDAGNEIRIIRISDFDACPCSGPHVNNTSQIGEFVFLSSDYNDGVLRIRFKLNRPRE